MKKEKNISTKKTNDENGQNKCPKCGSTEISNIEKSDELICNFCRHKFKPTKIKNNNISELSGINISEGAQNIEKDATDIVTLKCESCGAEVVIDTQETLRAKCHWCRNDLSLNSKVPNGAVPDMVLPFFITKEDAEREIREFVKSRSFFANSKFKKQFTTENIKGVYFPYMVIDVNAHCHFEGEGEHLVRRYDVGSGDDRDIRYDAEAYKVMREFDIEIDDLTIESSKDKLNTSNENNTNNVINAIMPFDIVNCVKWDANYLKGYTSEKRDVNVGDLGVLLRTQGTNIAKFSCNNTLTHYDRGVRWDTQRFDVKGEDWEAVLLPVWLYSYMEEKNGQKLLHYVAVNARTKEVMGSVPINKMKLFIISAIIEIFSLSFIPFIEDSEGINILFLLLPGILFYSIIYARYRNQNARHTYEIETKNKVSKMKQQDDFTELRTRLKNSEIMGKNNKTIDGVNQKNKFF